MLQKKNSTLLLPSRLESQLNTWQRVGKMDFEYTIKIRNRDITIKYGSEILEIGNDGIGPYEFWGSVGYDKGTVFVESFSIDHLLIYSERRDEWVKPSDRLSAFVEKMIDNDDRISEWLAEDLDERAEAQRSYYADMKMDERREREHRC